MANEMRIRRNFMYGTLVSTFINVGDVALQDASFTSLPAVPATAHMAITFEDIATHAFEIMYVIQHTAGSDKILVKRAQEGTVQSTWAAPTNKWVHCPTQRDWQGVGNNNQTQLMHGTNYPAAYTPVGARNITLKADAGDVVELSYSVIHTYGSFVFDFWTLVGGKRMTQCSTKMYTQVTAGSSSYVNGLPGSLFNNPEVYADLNNVAGYHKAIGDTGLGGTWLYNVQSADIYNGTATFSWYCFSSTPPTNTNTYIKFNTDSGDGYHQGTASSGQYANSLNYGVMSAKNHGPRLYPG